MELVLGIDVAKAKLDVALRLENGKIRSKVIPNTPEGFKKLTEWLSMHEVQKLHACMEATGTYWEAIAEYLSDAGYTVSVVNPLQIKSYGQSLNIRTKTDAIDARLIADFCASRKPEPWIAPKPVFRELRALVARREALVRMRTQEQNRLDVARESVKENIKSLITHINESIASVEKEIEERTDGDPDLKAKRNLLNTIPQKMLL